MIKRSVLYFICALMSLTGVAALAQMPTATVLGTIKDSTGALVAGAKITAKNADTNETRTATTEANGSYRLNALPVGNYEFRVDESGFKATVQSGITLTVGQEQVLDFALQVGDQTQVVDVTTDAPQMNTTSGTLGGTVTEQKMKELPLNGRDYIQLALLQSGTTEDRSRTPSSTVLAGQGTWFSSNGAPIRANAYLLDGTSLSTYGGGSGASISGNTLGLDGIREFRIVTNSFDAQYGMVMGSQMAMVSQQGSNAFHGDVYDYLRNSSMDARNFYDTPQGSGLSLSGAQRRLPPYRRNNYGGALGMPIQKDKMFVHMAYEGLSQLQGLTFQNTTIPEGCRGNAGAVITYANCPAIGLQADKVTPNPNVTISAVTAPWISLFPSFNDPASTSSNALYDWSFSQPTHEDYGQVRVDRTLSAKDNAFVRYTIDKGNTQNPGMWPGSPFLSTSLNSYLTASENHIFSENLLNTARVSWSRTTQLIGVLSYVSGAQYSYQVGSPMGSLTIGGVSPGAFGGNPTSNAIQGVFSYSDDLFITKGKHSLKIGALVNQYQVYVANGVSLYGTAKFASIPTFLADNSSSYQGLAPGGINYKDIRYFTLGEYIHDDYKVSSKLTLNLGLRYEINTDINVVGPSLAFNGALEDPVNDVNFTHTSLLTRNPSYHNFSPRLGFAYDVFGNGKTAIRGGFGELYQIASWVSFLHGATRAPFGQNQFSGSGAFTIPFTVPGSSALTARAPAVYDWNMKQPKMLQYNFAIQQQLPWQMTVTAAYGGSRGYDLQVLTDSNPTVPNGIPVVNGDGSISCGFANGTTTNRSSVAINQQNLVYGPSANTCIVPVVTKVSTVFPTLQTVSPFRQNQNWGPMNGIVDARDSWYNSLQIELRKNVTHGLQFQTNVTYSKLLDDTQGSTSGATEVVGSSTYASDPRNPLLDRGPASFNTPIVWKSNVIYHLPKVASGNHVVTTLANGWWATAIGQVQTGYPFTVTFSGGRSGMNVDGSNVAVVDRPMVVAGRNAKNITSGTTAGCTGVAAGQALGTRSLWYDPCGFSIQSSGFFGNEGRNAFTGPHYRTLDLSLVKDTKLPFMGEAGNLEVRAEVFNALNHTNFQLPAASVFAGTGALTNDVESPINGAAQITSALPSRQVQISAKIIF